MQFLIAMPDTIGAAAAALITDIKAAHNVYAKNAEDITSALVGLDGAINICKASKTPSRVLFKEVANTVCTALLLADAFGLDGHAVKNTVTMFLQQDPAPDNDVPKEDYTLHPDGIIATLEKLIADSCSRSDSNSELGTLSGATCSSENSQTN